MAGYGQPIDIQQVKDLQLTLTALDTDISTHVADIANPHGVTAAQAGAVALTAVGAVNGVASLDANGKVPFAQIPALALERMEVVADETARFALTTATVQNGDLVKQTDTLTTYAVVDDTNLNNAAGYVEIASPTLAPVDSVFGRIGAVTAAASDYDASQVDNDSTVAGAFVSDALNTLKTGLDAVSAAAVYLDITPVGATNDVNTDFTMKVSGVTADAIPGETDLYLNNIWMEPGVDYNWFSASVARFTFAPASGVRIRSKGRKA